ncbi:hypothetical protein CALCODRAFT_494130 [Calocera cornea HHB12733]|uniref:RING-type E3 ubiquitin transferase n=1 Tax=Calocera cornea HHB12733 TaxID=1353952 RepID=A0A165HBS1_9BASI|nr:hypothetical protein CALCODRAFT_494130 [Calocera cornea HHB12733]
MPPPPRSGGHSAAPSTSALPALPARPVRPLCRYIAMPGGCYAGERCKFRHSEEATKTPHQERQVCRYYVAGYCKRGADCWYRHVSDAPVAPEAGPSSRPAEPVASEGPPTVQQEDDDDLDELACMICYDKPLQYGLLAGCSHVFCLACMRGWRDVKDKEVSMLESGVVKACPVCRVPSRYITPSSQVSHCTLIHALC